MAEMDNISKKERVVPRKKVVSQSQADLTQQAQQIGAAVDQFEKSAAEDLEPKVETFSAPPEHTDPEPIFPGSAKPAVPASLTPAVAATPEVFEANEPKDERWRYFGYGFLGGALLLGGLIIFLLASAYGTANANLKAKNTQLQSQLQSLQTIQKKQSEGSTTGGSVVIPSQ